MDFEDLLLIATGWLLALVSDWLFSFWRNVENRRAQQEANEMLRKHGLSAHLYLPGIGTDDPALHAALDRIAFSGRVVIDRQGHMVGKLMPRAEKGPHLRLVVDNSN